MRLATPSYVCRHATQPERNKHNGLKNPNWREADQLVIYKHDRGVELESTEKRLELSGQSGT